MLRRFDVKKLSLQILGVLLFIILVDIIAWRVGPFIMPRVGVLFVNFFEYLTFINILAVQGGGRDGLLPHLLYTVERTLIGALVGLPLGVFVGMLLGKNEKLHAFCKHIVGALRIIPPLVLIPFFIMWFGPTVVAQFVMVVFYCTAMMIVTTTTAIGDVDKIYVHYAYSLGFTKNQVYTRVIIPLIIPTLIGGLRVALGITWGIQIVTELMGTRRGMGQVFSMMIPMRSIDVIIIGILWISIVAVIVDAILMKVAGRFTSWMPSSRN